MIGVNVDFNLQEIFLNEIIYLLQININKLILGVNVDIKINLQEIFLNEIY